MRQASAICGPFYPIPSRKPLCRAMPHRACVCCLADTTMVWHTIPGGIAACYRSTSKNAIRDSFTVLSHRRKTLTRACGNGCTIRRSQTPRPCHYLTSCIGTVCATQYGGHGAGCSFINRLPARPFSLAGEPDEELAGSGAGFAAGIGPPRRL